VKENAMLKLLVAVDGSDFSDRALDYVLRRVAASRDPVKVHLLNVQLPLSGVNVKLFISKESQQDYHRDEALAVLAPPRQRLLAAGVAWEHHIGVGDPGGTIAAHAGSLACDEVVMGTHGRGFLAGAVMGSVALRVVKLAPMPVVLVK